jgi:hypothetical protein
MESHQNLVTNSSAAETEHRNFTRTRNSFRKMLRTSHCLGVGFLLLVGHLHCCHAVSVSYSLREEQANGTYVGNVRHDMMIKGEISDKDNLKYVMVQGPGADAQQVSFFPCLHCVNVYFRFVFQSLLVRLCACVCVYILYSTVECVYVYVWAQTVYLSGAILRASSVLKMHSFLRMHWSVLNNNVDQILLFIYYVFLMACVIS